jgi:hypothetical protein
MPEIKCKKNQYVPVWSTVENIQWAGFFPLYDFNGLFL